MHTVARILLVEDSEADAELTCYALQRVKPHAEFRQVMTEPEFRDALSQFDPDLIISDFTLPTFDGLTALTIARAERPDVPFVFMSGTIGVTRAEQALRAGASDYVLKGDYDSLAAVVQRLLARSATL